MRAMTDEELRNFKDHVKCPWRECAGGLGLAGHGICSFRGEWDNPDCPEYITEEDYENETENRAK